MATIIAFVGAKWTQGEMTPAAESAIKLISDPLQYLVI